MTTFGFNCEELEVSVKFRILSIAQAEQFVHRYKDELPQNEYIFNVLTACVANIDSEVRPALARLDPKEADYTLLYIYNCCIMLNPVLDVKTWAAMGRSHNPFHHDMTSAPQQAAGPPPQPPSGGLDINVSGSDPQDIPVKTEGKQQRGPVLGKQVLNTLQRVLKYKIIGQDEPIDILFEALRRHQVGLNDAERPIGVYIFAGPSSVGKTLTAELLNEHLFGEDSPLARIDCGEFQHKHENSRLLGSPPGYVGHDEGGMLAKMVKKSVVLLDEIEKAHPDFWHTMLRVLDKGTVVDSKNRLLDFRNTVFILTSNLGNDKISKSTYGNQPGFGTHVIGDKYDSKVAPKRELVVRLTMEAIRDYFKPELLNRVDEIIVFNHLTDEDYIKIANLQFQQIKKKLDAKEFNLEWTLSAVELLIDKSSKAMEGARGMAKIRRKLVEDPIAALLYNGKYTPWKTFRVDAADGEFKIE
jgi:ATP-dependent Clp protease ATP-binding subunit ClpA